ncbi:phage tail sheath subtilisin-like domain-containing protein [Sphingomonas koreensis]|uniref:phage tail sheath subtilisin-like domain-containing protein n=1 Tax=Sphingomonas koreensis TaxID=93064 RepID=UPI000F7E92A7|nr:phage tail sheath subtilisin-like domain-containing protein [Sphingomonas koreensis]MDC7808796.1 phage tail sheath subtilisin-like domain-containing protein [Sphingomonas koreensis]RSU98935.1 phage tail protein [Sphingomonas koreensis]
MPVRHGIFINEPVEGARAIVEVATAVIGLAFTAPDADADLFPLNKPVLIGDVRAAIGSVGDTGTGAMALQAIYDQVSPIIVAVRCEKTANPEDQDAAIIGTIEGGAYSGIQALLAAESQVGVRPRILGVPGLDTAPVFAELGIAAERLRGMAYGYCAGATSVSQALLYAEDFAMREQMLIWPETSAGGGDIIARALGLRARIDEQIGWHKTISNVVVNGVSGLETPVFFDLQDPSTDAGLLNDGPVTTMIRKDGYRLWGNRTRSAEPLFAFESAVRTGQVLRDSIANGLLWAVDQPLSEGLVKALLDTINGDFALKVAQGRLIGARAWFDKELNPKESLAAGKLVLDWDYTPCAPMEDLTGNQRITDRYYADFGRNVV